MGRISKETIDKVKEATNVVDVLDECDVTLYKRGINYVALCPFHNDRALGNFVVSPTKNIYHCFSCGKTGDGLRYLMEHENMTFVDAIKWLGKKYGIEVEGSDDVKFTPKKIVKAVPQIERRLELLTLPMTMVTSKEDTTTDILCQWLRALPWGPMQRDCIERTLREYHVGHSKDGKTIWWQIDYEGRVRTGKLMLYKEDGHRNRDDKNSFDWIHTRLKKVHYYDPLTKEMETCPFGMHLAKIYPKATVNVVESEKTAVIMAIAYGNTSANIWIALGGKSFLSRSKLLPLIEGKRKILLYPDQDGIKEWREKMKAIGYENMRLAKSLVIDPKNPKKDCGDFIIERLYEIEEQRKKKELSKEPTAEELERYNCEQCKLLDLIAGNPTVDKLIEIFNLELQF
jgi:hypothetical protein